MKSPTPVQRLSSETKMPCLLRLDIPEPLALFHSHSVWIQVGAIGLDSQEESDEESKEEPLSKGKAMTDGAEQSEKVAPSSSDMCVLGPCGV